jgi:DNA-binding response OmpR family regulator
VLLVEDEPAVREFVQRALTHVGLTVLAAADGPAALESARTHEGRIDILVTDVVMPHMNGPELARLLRETRPDLPVLFISGYSGDGQRLAESESELTAYLQKPFQSAELLARIAALLAGAEAGIRRV